MIPVGMKPGKIAAARNLKRSSLTKSSAVVVNLTAILAILLMASIAFSRSSSTAVEPQLGSTCTNGGCRREALSTRVAEEDSQISLSTYKTVEALPTTVTTSVIEASPEPIPLDSLVATGEEVPLESVLTMLAECETFDCVRQAHTLINGRTKFNFPHYFLVGWQKCATTSVNAYLRHHPQYLYGLLKESHWFSQCKVDPNSKNCHAESEGQYMREYLRLKEAAKGGLGKVTFDASVDYARKGEPLAADLYSLFPWIKIVMIMREPISRVISYSRMYTERGHGEKGCFHDSPLYDCLQPFFEEGNPRTAHYDDAMAGWIKVFPSDQIHVIQFEQLQEDPNKILHDLKIFLGMDPTLPKIVLSNLNNRKAGGYPMHRAEYQELVDKSLPHAERLAAMLDEAGLANGEEWMARWLAVWKRQVEEGCDENDQCLVNSN